MKLFEVSYIERKMHSEIKSSGIQQTGPKNKKTHFHAEALHK